MVDIIGAEMDYQGHIQTARDFLVASEREFADGDKLQACEKLWGAASHAVMAYAVLHDWKCQSHRDLKNAVTRISDVSGDRFFRAAFAAAETFHENFYHDGMEDYTIAEDRVTVRDFVESALALVEPTVG